MADYRDIDIKEYAENGLADVAGLLSRREYSLSIVRARQIEERLIRSYAAEQNIEYSTLADTIEQLYAGGYINMTSRDAYHTIRLYGNKVVHEAAESEDDAQNAYYLLKNEIQTFLSRKNVSVDRTPVRVSRETKRPVNDINDAEPYRGDRAASDGMGYEDMPRRSSREAAGRTQRASGSRDERGRKAHRQEQTGRNGRRTDFDDEERNGISIYDILRVLIPVVVVILIVIIIKSLLPSKPAATETTPTAVETTAAETESAETETETETQTEPETTTEAETEPEVRYSIIDDGTNIRYADNQERIYTQLAAGTDIGPVTPVDGTDFVQFTLDGVSVVVRKDLIRAIE